MKEFLSDIKQIGIRGAVSNAVVSAVYGVKGKFAIAKSNFNSMRIKEDMLWKEEWEEKFVNPEEDTKEEGSDEDETTDIGT